MSVCFALWEEREQGCGVEGTALVLGGDVEMLGGGSACGASDTDWEAGEDGLALCGEDSGEVAVADEKVTMADGDEVAGTRVVADSFNCAIEHGIDKGVVGGEVDAVVHRVLAGKWVGAVAER